MLTLHLVRHGAAQDAEGRALGHTDPPLSLEGLEQAKSLVERWTRAPGRIVSSDLRRATETAAPLAEFWGLDAKRDARLREMNFGEWDGSPWTVVEREDPARLQSWMETWVATRVPGGESFTDLAARAWDWFAAERVGYPEGEIVVVAHAGSIRALLCRLLEVDLAEAFSFPVDRGRIATVALSGAGARLVALNSVSPGTP
jgi:broad specificity phosphatase PhoE